MYRFISIYFIVLAIVLIFSLCFFVPVFSQYDTALVYSYNNSDSTFNLSNSNLIWPTPGFTYITSPFGYRNAPTSGAGTYHGGIDIGAPERYKYSCSCSR